MDLGIKIKIELPPGTQEVHKLIQKYFNENPFKITINGFDKQFEQVKNQVNQIKKEIENINQITTIKATKSILSGEGYRDLQKRVDEIRNSTDKYAKVIIDTEKNTGKLKQAVIEYTDSVGRAVKETMKWVTTTKQMTDGTILIENKFTTTGFKFIDNIVKATRSAENLNVQINKLDNMLNRLQTGKFSKFVDQNELNNIRNLISSLNSLDKIQLQNIKDRIAQLAQTANLEFTKVKQSASLFQTQLNAINTRLAGALNLEGKVNLLPNANKDIENLKQRVKDYKDYILQIDQELRTKKQVIPISELNEELRMLRLLKTELENIYSSQKKIFSSSASKTNISNVVPKQEIELFVNTLKSGLGQSATVVDYVYDKFGKLTVSIKTAENEIKNLVYQYDNLQKKFVDVNQITRVPDLKNQTEQLVRQQQEFKRIYEQFERLKRSGNINFTTDVVGTSKLLNNLTLMDSKVKILSNGIQRITQDFKLNDSQILRIVANYNKLSNTLDVVSQSTHQVINRQLGLREAINVALEKFSLWTGVSTLVMSAIHKVQESFDFMLETSKQFTNLQMEMTQQKLVFSDITKQAYEYASAMGSTTDAVMQAIAVFGTYTSTMDQVLQKSRAAIILSNITGQTVEQSANQIMAVLSQFSLGAESAMKVVDLAGSVARQLQVDYPIAVREISMGIRTVGNVAKEAGMSLEETSSVVGTVMEKTRRTGTEVGEDVAPYYGNIVV